MAQNLKVSVPALTWTLLTNSSVTAISFQAGGQMIRIAGTTSTTQPATTNPGYEYSPGQGEVNRPLADLFPGIAATRVWAFCMTNTEVTVSHA